MIKESHKIKDIDSYMRAAPQRPDGFYESVLLHWRSFGVQAGLTEIETVMCAAQFTGLAIAAAPGNAKVHDAHLDTATRAMHTAYLGRVAVRNGFGRPVKPNTSSA